MNTKKLLNLSERLNSYDNLYKSIISQNQTFARVISPSSSSLQNRLPGMLCHCKLLDGMPSIHRKEGEHMRQLMEVENPMVLGTIESVNSVPTFRYIERDFRDIYGSLIVYNDDYMEFPNGDIVHLDNIHTYLEDNYNARFYTKK